MEGTIVLGQRALRAEPATAGAVAAIKIVTRTEHHRACPKGTTSEGEREDPIRSPRQQMAFITEFAPKNHQSQARLLALMRTRTVTALLTFPIQRHP